MKASEALKQTWDAVVAEAPEDEAYYHRRIPLNGAWPAHAGVHRPTGARIVILETDVKSVRDLRLKGETKGYAIEVTPDLAGRSDRSAIRIQETSTAYREIFVIFCSDIIENWISHRSAHDAVTALAGRLARWMKFFQRGAALGLTREEHIGLYGELSFIESALTEGIPDVHLVNGWQAPLSTNQDFLFGQLAVEVKVTTANEADQVRITNVRQLDATGIQALFLARYAFDFRQGSGRTLRELVAQLKSALAKASPDALAVFNDRLLESGFVEAVPNELDSWGFTLRQFDTFSVREGFPRILESTLPAGVSELAYTLNLAAAREFHVPDSQFWKRVISTYG